jgi:hypothetical protein
LVCSAEIRKHMASFLRKRFGSDKLIETVAGVVNSALVLRFGASLFDLVYPIGIAMHLERHSVQPGRRRRRQSSSLQ